MYLLFRFVFNKLLKCKLVCIAGINSSDGRVVRTSASGAGLGFYFESGPTNDFKFGIQSFTARHLALKGQCGEKAGKFTCCAIEKGT